MERELENKVDMEVFDTEIAGLKALIGNIDDGVNSKSKLPMPSASNSSGLNSKEIASLK